MTWPFGDLRPFSFDLIMADPPWRFDNWSSKGEGRNPSAHYGCMDLAALKALPVGDLAAPNSVLWMWATNPLLPQAIEVMRAWGFRYATAGTWAKQSKTGRKWAFGTGYVLRSANEPFLIGTVGAPALSRAVRSMIVAPVREHSRKPDAAYAAAARMIAPQTAPHPPLLLDLFSREARPGWSAWGNEAGKFNEEEELS